MNATSAGRAATSFATLSLAVARCRRRGAVVDERGQLSACRIHGDVRERARESEGLASCSRSASSRPRRVSRAVGPIAFGCNGRTHWITSFHVLRVRSELPGSAQASHRRGINRGPDLPRALHFSWASGDRQGSQRLRAPMSGSRAKVWRTGANATRSVPHSASTHAIAARSVPHSASTHAIATSSGPYSASARAIAASSLPYSASTRLVTSSLPYSASTHAIATSACCRTRRVRVRSRRVRCRTRRVRVRSRRVRCRTRRVRMRSRRVRRRTRGVRVRSRRVRHGARGVRV